jgi:hypothetical protein
VFLFFLLTQSTDLIYGSVRNLFHITNDMVFFEERGIVSALISILVFVSIIYAVCYFFYKSIQFNT